MYLCLVIYPRLFIQTSHSTIQEIDHFIHINYSPFSHSSTDRIPANMPPKKSPPPIPATTRFYLTLYNALSFALWATCTLRTASLIASLAPTNDLPQIFEKVYSPLLTTTQSLAILEIIHSLIGLVRAPVTTTAMQVASRLLLVWGVMYPFGGDIVGNVNKGVQLGDYAFLGCLAAWGVTERIRYGFFAIQVSGLKVPSWWIWLRYFPSFLS